MTNAHAASFKRPMVAITLTKNNRLIKGSAKLQSIDINNNSLIENNTVNISEMPGK